MSSNVREKIMGWLTGDESCFLLGAGCSLCAGKPLIAKLTEQVVGKNSALSEHLKKIKPTDGHPATIEDLINYFIRCKSMLDTTRENKIQGISAGQTDNFLKEIKDKIVEKFSDNWESSPVHERFLQRLCDRKQMRPRDIFSLNYDTVLEASLDELRLPYVDGFRGANRAWFDAETFSSSDAVCRIFKLHGSINWVRDTDGNVRRRHGRDKNMHNDESIVVYPSEQKYIQTQYGVYETLIGQFRERLRNPGITNNCLIVLGYSFNDQHINEAICDAVTSTDNLTVVAFVGPESDSEKQAKRFDEIERRCKSRFNTFIGTGKARRPIGHATDDEEEEQEILDLDLWKFEKLVDYIAGEPT